MPIRFVRSQGPGMREQAAIPRSPRPTSWSLRRRDIEYLCRVCLASREPQWSKAVFDSFCRHKKTLTRPESVAEGSKKLNTEAGFAGGSTCSSTLPDNTIASHYIKALLKFSLPLPFNFNSRVGIPFSRTVLADFRATQHVGS